MTDRAHLPMGHDSPAEAAAWWFSARRRTFDGHEEQAFRAWLEADPINRYAYDEVTRSWEIAGLAGSDSGLIAMRSEALMLRREARSEHPRLWGALATAAMFLLAVSGAYLADPTFVRRAVQPAADRDDVVFQTALGQRATATLEDGSTVTLNTSSVLQVDYSRARRTVRLLAGQVLFDVAKDLRRPFVVLAGDRQIVALGTQFDVRLEGGSVRVALLEGQIRVQPIAADQKAIRGGTQALRSAAILGPGEQLLVTTSGEMIVKTADVEEMVSWKTGRVRFDNTPLAEAVAEMNRYSRTPIVIEDPAIADIRISGAFRTGHSRSFADAISEAFPVEVESEPNVIRLHQPG